MGEKSIIGDSKDAIRQRIILLRECIPEHEREKASARIFERFFKLPEYQDCEYIFAFAGFNSEVSTLNAVFKMINSGKKVALPKVLDSTHMEFFEVNKISDIKKSPMGIPEPAGELKLVKYKPEMILVPGSVFDTEYNRMGYGRGYYDRYLRGKGYDKYVWKVGLCFACQLVPNLPSEEHDVPVDMIITENEVIR